MRPADIPAVIVTRGDVDLTEILESLIFTDVVVWNNSEQEEDAGAYGRYLAAFRILARDRSSHVYLQDDDCLVAPEVQDTLAALADRDRDLWISNMNPDHNARMPHLALPGYGAVAPIARLAAAADAWRAHDPADFASDDFRRVGCDIVIPVLCPSRMVDLGHHSFGYAWNHDRTHRQPGYADRKADYYRRAAALRGTMRL